MSEILRKASIISTMVILLLNMLVIGSEPLSPASPTEALRYGMDVNVTNVDASFHGEEMGDYLGRGFGSNGIKGSGDVNGDGYDDIIIGSMAHNRSSKYNGKAYLYFGKPSGWTMNMNVSTADVTFHGEYDWDLAGSTVGIIGDVNNDTLDDILISAPSSDDGGTGTGQVYLILGKATGWNKVNNLSSSDASFIHLGIQNSVLKLSGAGDVNGDGIDDILIGVPNYHGNGIDRGIVYLILGRETGWSMHMNMTTNASASFVGSVDYNTVGHGVAGVGDVNNDGFNDILMDGIVNTFYLEAYLFYGRASGWTTNTSTNDANVTFFEETVSQGFWYGYAAAGDVNGDDIDDIVIGFGGFTHNGTRLGKTYLFFGKNSGWSERAGFAANADASFIREYGAYFGANVDGAGDVNNDGFDDIIISAMGGSGGPGPKYNDIYLIMGKASGWVVNVSVSSVAASSFETESYMDEFGSSLGFAGDVNNDSFDDILIGANMNNEFGYRSGQVYLIFPELEAGPKTVYSVKAYSDPGFSNEITYSEIWDTVYVELTALDENATFINHAAVNVSNSISTPAGFRIYLVETGINTGVFRGSFKITNETHHYKKHIKAELEEHIKVESVTDPTKSTSFLVSVPIQLRRFLDEPYAFEDEKFSMEYWSYGQNSVTEWVFDSNASWLAWDSSEHRLYGTPDNSDVGTYYVRVNITDGLGNYDEHFFDLQVHNTATHITTTDINGILEDEFYYVDYTSDDDGQGSITWTMSTNASWLVFDNATGELSGTPTNSERGSYWVNITVQDGNGGTDWTNFTLTVTDVNDPPVITTTDVTIVDEDSFYMVAYNAVDIDGDSDFRWYLDTDADWLSINENTGILAGTPLNEHVGFNYVNVTVKDPKDGEDSQNFTIEVRNTNDPPVWSQVPITTEMNESDVFAVNIRAIDVDKSDVISYQLDHKAPFEIRLDNETGEIAGKADLETPRSMPLTIEINIYATDGNITIWESFDLTVIPNLRPEVDLQSPADNARVGSSAFKLKWSGFDVSDDHLTYDVYLGRSMTDVIELNGSTRILHNTELTSYTLKDLEAGTIYYWTVIPFDGLNYGQCVDSVLGFVINSPPEFPEVITQTVKADSRYELDINAQDDNLDDVPEFEYGLLEGPEGLSISNETGEISWFPTSEQIGTHTVTIRVSDGFDTTNMTFEITVTEPPEIVDRDLKPILITTSSLTILLIILSIFIAGTEVGKYKFFSILFVPMYNKLHPDKVLDNYTRGKIHGFIQAKPGEHYNSIKSALKLNNGTLTHHTRVLEKEGFIYTRRDGLYTRFFPTGVKLKAMEIANLNEIQKKMVESLHKYPGMAQHEIISMLEITQQVGSYHLSNLARDDYIMAEQLNGEKKYYINYDKLSITDEE